MNDTTNNPNGESSHTKERLATLEAAIKYHSHSLDDISKTLKEVVKIQAMLANQRDEILQMTKSLDWVVESTYRQDKDLSNEKLKIESLRGKLDKAVQENNTLGEQVKTNTRIIKLAIAILVLVVAPSGVAFLASIVL